MESLGNMAFLEELCHLGQALGVCGLVPLPGFSSFCVFKVLPHFLLAAMHPTLTCLFPQVAFDRGV